MSDLTKVYEELLAGKKVTISLACAADISTIYSRLRVVKYKYDKKFVELTGEKISEDKVIHVVADINAVPPIEVLLYLGERKIRTGVEFTIVKSE